MTQATALAAALATALAAALLAPVAARADDGYRLIHTFPGLPGGWFPEQVTGHSTTAAAQDWALYGLTHDGGDPSFACGQGHCGIAYRLMPPAPGSVHWTEQRLYVFKGGNDGLQPSGPLVFDATGAAYGITLRGGRYDSGTVFRLTPPSPGQYFWDHTILHHFTGTSADGRPSFGIVVDPAGTIYGTAFAPVSGTHATIYKLVPPAAGKSSWAFTTLHTFTDAEGNGSIGLALDSSGSLYGGNGVGANIAFGTIFRLSPPAASNGAWTYTELLNFNELNKRLNPKGIYIGGPDAMLVIDSSGALYGHSFFGNDGSGQSTVVYRLNPPAPGQTAWSLQTLRYFRFADGGDPLALSIVDNLGDVYGLTTGAGSGPNGPGTPPVLFKLAPPGAGQTTWSYSKLHAFNGPPGYAGVFRNGLTRDPAGTLYGVGTYGGPGPSDQGFAFKLTR